ncbi:MAG: hypothetical protein BYD32DRAFT_409893 [Podila humilis]|nr:MAG: hypothetical protein BYD32DRAFT_409893 [Podila humilis]
MQRIRFSTIPAAFFAHSSALTGQPPRICKHPLRSYEHATTQLSYKRTPTQFNKTIKILSLSSFFELMLFSGNDDARIGVK